MTDKLRRTPGAVDVDSSLIVGKPEIGASHVIESGRHWCFDRVISFTTGLDLDHQSIVHLGPGLRRQPRLPARIWRART